MGVCVALPDKIHVKWMVRPQKDFPALSSYQARCGVTVALPMTDTYHRVALIGHIAGACRVHIAFVQVFPWTYLTLFVCATNLNALEELLNVLHEGFGTRDLLFCACHVHTAQLTTDVHIQQVKLLTYALDLLPCNTTPIILTYSKPGCYFCS